MANTVMSAKNTFAEGLVMDFAPDNTQATTLTSALNATLLTFNGNEMSLQNDMGNGRVETAYLPEGYVPVGTCEFGDIIYIVSYNPIINKSQIGCFPSPERNISSDEVGGLGQSLKWTDFQGSDGSGPNGEIVASSVKKILYGTKDMTSGDKYIIYSAELDSAGNHEYLSDYGNTSHQHERFPKLVKIHVVSIEESGKITYLDSSTKWYKENDFYIQNSKKIVDKPDLDSYRTMVSSAYSIFSSKVSGKLALLVELEKITGFSCTWSAYTKEMDDNSDCQLNKYSIYWNFSWNTDDNNINPNAVVLTQSKWTGEDDTRAGKYQIWEKDEDRDGWVLGGKNKNWVDGPSIPVAYPNVDYNYRTISRVYNPETYRGTFENFINSGSYDAQSKARLDQVKQELGLSNVELIKANLSRNTEGTPDEGKYYFNCSSSSISKDGKVTYYTNYENELKAISPKEMSDDIINNTFNYPIVKHFADFLIPIKQKVVEDNVEEWKNLNINNLIYYYELTPSMPYGLLREFSQDGYIDFKKIGTKSIELNSWRYYNYENTSTLTWGLEAYTEPNKGISEVVFLFYDNQGLAAAYHNSGKISYNGKFTEYLTLNTSGTNYKLNSKNEKNETFYHKGERVSKDFATISNTYLDSNGKVISIDDMQDGVDYYLNDAGTIYSNCLYLVKIIVKYCSIGVLDEYIEDETSYIEDYRWYWTNTMFNNYYYSVRDFKDLQFSLNLDCQAVFETVPEKWEVKQTNYTTPINFLTSATSSGAYKTLSSKVQYVNQDNSQNDNLRMAIRAGLQNDFNTFNIEEGQLKNIGVRIFLANEYLSNNPEQPSIKFTGVDTTILQGIYPTQASKLTGKADSKTSERFNQLIGAPVIGVGEELSDSPTAYENYTNNFHLSTTRAADIATGNANGKLVYINSNGDEEETLDYTEYKTTLERLYYDEQSQKINTSRTFPLTLSGIYHSKYYYITKQKTQTGILRSFVLTDEDLEYYSLGINNNNIQFTRMLFMAMGDQGGDNSRISGGIPLFQGNTCMKTNLLPAINRKGQNSDKGGGDKDFSIQTFIQTNYSSILDVFHFLFPVGFGYHWGTSMKEATRNGVVLSPNSRISEGVYTSFQLAGTLAGVTTSGLVEPGDHYTNISGGEKNSLTAFIPIVLGCLTQFFYLDSNEYTIYVPDNYVYLDTNSLHYKRDIVIELSPLIQSNTLIVFRGWPYPEYLQEILHQFEGEENSEVSSSAKNVQVKVEGCLKTQPLEFQFQYMKPDIINDFDSGTYIQSVYENIPTLVAQSFQPDTIYHWNNDSQSFEHHRGSKKIWKSNYSVNQNTIRGNMTSVSYSIQELSQLLTLSGTHLAISSIPNNCYGTYSVKTHKDRSMTDFKSNLKYYK